MSESESLTSIPTGVHKIHNAKYVGNTQVADLVRGGPGPIDGRKDSVAHNDKWHIRSRFPGSNEVTIENAVHPGVYAYAHLKLHAPVEGKNFGPNEHPTVWTLVNRGGGKYNIQAPFPHNDLLWELTAPDTPIRLGDYHKGTQPYNEWTF